MNFLLHVELPQVLGLYLPLRLPGVFDSQTLGLLTTHARAPRVYAQRGVDGRARAAAYPH